MKLILWATLLAFLTVGNTWAQEPPTRFSFAWESGESSRDMRIEKAIWQLDGTTLKFSESVHGRDEGLPKMKSLLRDKVFLNKSQLSKMTSILETLVNESSFSLLPKNFEGPLLEYTLSFGIPPRIVYFAAPQNRVVQMTNESTSGAAKLSSSNPESALYFKMDALRDYLVELSSRS